MIGLSDKGNHVKRENTTHIRELYGPPEPRYMKQGFIGENLNVANVAQ